MSDTIGFIGTGIMGKPMAENVLEAGYDVVAHNRSPEPVEDLADRGAQPADSAKEVAEEADVIVSVLPDTEVVMDVMYADDGILEGLSSGKTYIDMSTISPVETEEIAADLAELDVDMLDAPISGGEEGAIEGTLSIMVGGDEAVLERHRDLLEVMGSSVTLCGPNGAGQITKACNQIVVGVTYEAVSEAIVLAHKAGADVEAMVEAISGGAAGNWVLDNRAPGMIRGEFDPGFFASYQYKDLRIATSAGEAYNAVMPATQLVHDMYKSMEARGLGRDDHSGLLQIIEDLSDTTARIE